MRLTWCSPSLETAIHEIKRSKPSLAEEQIRQWLRRARRERKVPLTPLAEFIGTNRKTLHEVANGGKISHVMRGRLTPLIELIDQGGMRFERCGRGWHLVYKEKPPARKRRRHNRQTSDSLLAGRLHSPIGVELRPAFRGQIHPPSCR